MNTHTYYSYENYSLYMLLIECLVIQLTFILKKMNDNDQ